MQTFTVIFLGIGFIIGITLFGWAAVSSVRRHGFREAVRRAAAGYVDELPLYWRVPVVAWLFVIALPLIAVEAIINGEWETGGAISVAIMWLLYVALLRWHYRAKSRALDSHHHRRE